MNGLERQEEMKIITSVSGGQTSAFIAANYPFHDLVFALVRTDDNDCRFQDRKLARKVEDRIQADFVGTLEDDIIINTIFDLEQMLGTSISWVTGQTFDEVIQTRGGWLPSVKRRYCTTWLKLEPIFHWWYKKYNAKPVYMNIGYRANERNRAAKMIDQINENGFQTYRATFEKWVGGRHDGLNKWQEIEWRKPKFPLVEDMIFKDEIESFWKDKNVRFAEHNNCVGCFHRSANLLNRMAQSHSNKFEWFVKAEQLEKGFWKKNISYEKIKELQPQLQLDFTSNCQSGFCGM